MQEHKPSGLHGLNRFKTVLGRRRQSTMPYNRTGSPERKNTSSTNLGSSLFGGKGKNKESKQSERPTTPARRLSEQTATPRASDVDASPKPPQTSEGPNGISPSNDDGPSTEEVNGTQPSIPELQEPLQPSSPTPAFESASEVSILNRGQGILANQVVAGEEGYRGLFCPTRCLGSYLEG